MNTDHFLPALVELLLKGAVILVATTLLHRAARRGSAAFRHLIWVAGFTALLLLPLTRLASPRWSFSFKRDSGLGATAVQSAGIPAAIPGLPAKTWPPPVQSARHPERATIDWKLVAISVWLTGVLGLTGHCLVGSLQLWRLRQRSLPLINPRLIELAACAAAEIGIKRTIDLRVSPDRCVPITWGTCRPIILLPAEFEQWSEEHCEATLRHELGHIARNDYLTRWLVHFATALHWPNPLAWWSGQILRTLQEQACDDLVLRAGTDSNNYARLLIETARSIRAQGFAARQAVSMARPSSLEKRVVAIVDENRRRDPAGRTAHLVAIALAFLSLTISTVAQLKNEPPPLPAPTEDSANAAASVLGTWKFVNHTDGHTATVALNDDYTYTSGGYRIGQWKIYGRKLGSLSTEEGTWTATISRFATARSMASTGSDMR
jgi:beta-lactamase regulating signal transducer with metallopeptidase domain